MVPTFLGISYYIWGVACLILAAIYTVVWPRPRGPATGLRLLIMRWFHTLVWALLAASCFVRAIWRQAGTLIANDLALLALGLYLIFLATFLLDRRQSSRGV